MRIAFRFKLLPFIATVLVVALGIALGNWQERRAAQKVALEHKLAVGNAAAPVLVGATPLAAASIEWRRVAVTGQFVTGWPVYLDNRPYQGRPGFYVLMPMQIAGSTMHVLVERGWLPLNLAARDKLPAYGTPQGTVTIEGIARLSAGHVMSLGAAPSLRPGAIVQNAEAAQVAADSGLAMQPFVLEQSPAIPAGGDDGLIRDWPAPSLGAAPSLRPGAIVQNAEVAQVAADSGLAMQPFVLEQSPAIPAGGDDGLIRDWPAPSLGVEKHRGYAFQWYSLALMAGLFFVFNGYRSGINSGSKHAKPV